jgi:hypothetical protein
MCVDVELARRCSLYLCVFLDVQQRDVVRATIAKPEGLLKSVSRSFSLSPPRAKARLPRRCHTASSCSIAAAQPCRGFGE